MEAPRAGLGSRVVELSLRLLLADPLPGRAEELSILECNIDDMRPELYPHLLDRLLESGARGAWIAPLVMKKGRPGMLVSVLCEGRDEDIMTKLLFAETTTPGGAPKPCVADRSGAAP